MHLRKLSEILKQVQDDVKIGSLSGSMKFFVLRNAELTGAFKGWIGSDGTGEIREPIQ